MTTWLITINVVVFIVDVLTYGRLTEWGCLSGAGISRIQVWRLITFQFLHAGPFHLIFNMLWFYFLGPLAEWRMGKRRFLTFYLICGICGGAAFLIQWWLRERVIGVDTILVGASAGIFGIMAAAVVLAPSMTFRLWFPPVSLSLRAMFWIMIGLALITLYTGGFNGGGEASHLGGAAIGALLIRKIHWLNPLAMQRRQNFWKPGDTTTPFFRGDV
jgi:rhomboid family protein